MASHPTGAARQGSPANEGTNLSTDFKVRVVIPTHTAEILLSYHRAFVRRLERKHACTLTWTRAGTAYACLLSAPIERQALAASKALENQARGLSALVTDIPLHPGIAPYVVFDNWAPLRQQTPPTTFVRCADHELSLALRLERVLESDTWQQFLYNSQRLTVLGDSLPLPVARLKGVCLHFTKGDLRDTQTVRLVAPKGTALREIEAVVRRRIAMYEGWSHTCLFQTEYARCLFGLNGEGLVHFERQTGTTIKADTLENASFRIFGAEGDVRAAATLLEAAYTRVRASQLTFNVTLCVSHALINQEKQLSGRICGVGSCRFHVQLQPSGAATVFVYGRHLADVRSLRAETEAYALAVERLSLLLKAPAALTSLLLRVGVQKLVPGTVHLQHHKQGLRVYGISTPVTVEAHTLLAASLAALSNETTEVCIPKRWESMMIGAFGGESVFASLRREYGVCIESCVERRELTIRLLVVGPALARKRVTTLLYARLEKVKRAVGVVLPHSIQEAVLHGFLAAFRERFSDALVEGFNNNHIFIAAATPERTQELMQIFKRDLQVLVRNRRELPSMTPEGEEALLKTKAVMLEAQAHGVYWLSSTPGAITGLEKAVVNRVYNQFRDRPLRVGVAWIPHTLRYLFEGVATKRLEELESLLEVTIQLRGGSFDATPNLGVEVILETTDPRRLRRALVRLQRRFQGVDEIKWVDRLRLNTNTPSQAVPLSTPPSAPP